MVLPKIGTQLILKRVADEILVKPAAVAEGAEPQSTTNIEVSQKILNDLDGHLVRNAEGEPVGVARRMQGASIYVVASPGSDPSEEIRKCLEEDESQILYLWTDDVLTGVVFVPDPERIPPPPNVMRAEDI